MKNIFQGQFSGSHYLFDISELYTNDLFSYLFIFEIVQHGIVNNSELLLNYGIFCKKGLN